MIVLIVLGVAVGLSRGLGVVGLEMFNSWPAAVRGGLAVMFVFTGVAHFTSLKHDMVAISPSWVPWPMAIVYFTGVCEIVGGLALLLPSLRVPAGVAMIALLIAVFPANVKAASIHEGPGAKLSMPLVYRAPMQALTIGLVAWSAIYARNR